MYLKIQNLDRMAGKLYKQEQGLTVHKQINKPKEKESVMNRKMYDTKKGIQSMVRTLHGFNKLIKLRREAPEAKENKLSDFYILGRWYLSLSGGIWKLSGEYIPKNIFPGIPDVLLAEEYHNIVDFSSELSPGCLPPAHLRCGECEQVWSIENCHDVIMIHDKSDAFKLDEFVGRQLWEMNRFFARKSDAIYDTPGELMIRNDRFIDMSPDLDFVKEHVNERGRISKADGLDVWYVIQPGDETFFDVWKDYHTACWREKITCDIKNEIRGIFASAGFNVIGMSEIANQYCQCIYCAPWYEVETSIGIFTIGRRERVININWSKTGINFLPLFENEHDVTKDETSIHAWSNEKAIDYLYRIRIINILDKAWKAERV